MIFQANGYQRKMGMAMLISHKIDLESNILRRNKKGHCIMMKGLIHQEDIPIINIYNPSIWAPKFIRKILRDLKGELNNQTITEGDFNDLIPAIDRL